MQARHAGRTLAGALAITALLLFLGVPPVHGQASPVRSGAARALATDALALPSGISLRSVPADQTLRLTATLAPTDPSGLAELLSGVSDPRSPEYRHFLTQAQFAQRFGPTAATERSVEGYFAGYGAYGFQASPDGFSISFALPVAGATRALGISFMGFGVAGHEGFTALGTPQLPRDLSGVVTALSGLSGVAGGFGSMSSARAVTPPSPATGPGAWVTDGAGAGEPWFLGSDYASAFHVAQLFPPSSAVANATFPSGEAVATVLMSGYNASLDADTPPYDPVVVQAYFNDTFPTGWPQPNVSGVPVNVSGVTPPAPGYFNGVNDTTSNSVENSLDLEMAGSTAPGARLVNFYFSGSLFSSPRYTESLAQVADAFAECLGAALTHNYSPARLAVVSGSFGLTDLNDSLWNTELEVAAATGVTVLAASGDQGNAPNVVSGRFQGPNPTWPGSAAFNDYGTVSVGGTTVTLDGSATSTVGSNETLNASFDASVTSVVAQTAWFDTLGGFGNVSGTEGGVSTVVPEPSWQFHSAAQPAVVNATVDQGSSALGRAEPDVAFPANETIAYVARDPGGIYYEVLEGTSVASPLLAGMIASWSAVAGHPFGYLDPELYRIASYFAMTTLPPSATASPYLDVLRGSNYLFNAGPGWDPLTGWGGIDAVRFLAADANATVRNYTYTGPTPGLPPPPSVSAGTPDEYLLLTFGVAIAGVVLLALALASRRSSRGSTDRPSPGETGAPWLAQAPPVPVPLPAQAPGLSDTWAPPAPATFQCPYCGAPRPAEPTRCPACGRL